MLRAALFAALVLLCTACERSAVTAPVQTADPTSNVAPAFAFPCDIRWAAAVSGDWSDGTKWDLGREPGFNEQVCIEVPGAYTVTVDGTQHVGYAYVGDGTSSVSLVIETPRVGKSFSMDGWGIDVRKYSRVEFMTGSVVDVSGLDVVGSVEIQGTHAIRSVDVESGGVLTTTGDTHLSGVESFYLDGGTIALLGGHYLSVQMDSSSWNRIDLEGGLVGGDGALFVNASAGDTPEVSWDDAVLGTRPGDPSQPIVVLRGADLKVWGDGVGAIEIDPAGDPVALSGTIGPNQRVRVRRAQWGGAGAPVSMGDGGDPLTNDGELEFSTSLSHPVPIHGHLVNRGTVTALAGRFDFTLDSMRNEGTLQMTDSVRLVSGTLRNLGTVTLIGGAADLVMANAEYAAEPGGVMSGRLTLEGGGRVSGSGVLDRVVSFGGTVSPGNAHDATGALTFGTLTLDGTSRVIVDVGGTSGGSHDVVHATGLLQLAGTLEARVVAPFVAARCGQVVQPVTNAKLASRTGVFGSLAGFAVDPTSHWRLHSTATALQLIGFDPTRALGVAPGTIALREGGPSASVDVCLGRGVPTGTVTVSPSSRFAQGTPTPGVLAFTTSNWMQPQRLTVSALDDVVPEPAHVDSVRFRLTSPDAAYTGLAQQQLELRIADNDVGPDLTTVLVSNDTSATVGQPFDARFRVTNNGPVPSTSATFSISPLVGMTHLADTPGVTCTPSVGLLTCGIGSLATGASVEFTIAFQATASGTHANTVRVTAVPYDASTGNDRFTWSYTVR